MKTRILVGDGPSQVAAGGAVIATDGLSKDYDGVEALRDVRLTVPRNAIVGFLGPNGAGKSTAIRLLLGLARPTAGTATVFGLDSVRDSLDIRRRVGYLAQDPRFDGHLTAREILDFTARFFYRGSSSAIAARVAETLELVGLVDRADRPVGGFSGGERQRLGLAQAQVNRPDLLILDEPAAALDPLGRRDVLEVMERLRSQTTIFYSTHILDDVERVSDRVVILDRGRVVADSPTADLLHDGHAAFEVTVRGDGAAVASRLRREAWAADVSCTPRDGDALVRLHAADVELAEARLLRTVLAIDGTVVTAFGRRQFRLEDAFLELVKGSTS